MSRYAAKLLFVWDPDPITNRRDRRLCEERIVLFQSRSAPFAVKKAKSIGKASELRYDSGHRLRFAGVLQCMQMDEVFCMPGEVWYEMRRRSNPDMWARTAVPRESSLGVFADGRLAGGSAKRSAHRSPQPAGRPGTSRRGAR
jgi:hypothetical protein